MINSRGQKGFTMLEVIVVIIIFAVILGLSILYYQTTQVRTDLNGQVSQFVSYARLAQSGTDAGKNNSDHGIHLENNRYVLFIGSSYVNGAGTNVVIPLPPTIVIQNINLNGGGSDIVFERPYGETTDFGSVDFHSAQLNETKTITISNLGNINY
jgi:prepilin-type N-terminal cleavage/methylation domain-containing protein